MVLEVGTLICAVVGTLVALKESLAKAPTERRDRAADYFERVAVCVQDTANSLREGIYPQGRCAELAGYAQEMPSAIQKEVGREKSDHLATQLMEAHEVELLFSQRETPSGKEQIDRLDEAAGLLRALANNIRAGG